MTEDSDDRMLRLTAALDGELDALGALKFERELAADPALAAEFRRLAAVREAIRRHAPVEPAPQSLADQISRLAGAAATRAHPLPRFRWTARRPLALATSTAAIGFAVGVGLMSLRAPNADEGVAKSLVSDFARAAIVGQPVDVASSDRHTVKPWLGARTTVSPDIVDLAADGFPLAGGRVAIVDRIPAPTLVYRHGEHIVAVTELPLDLRNTRGSGGVETIDGYHVVRWTGANLAYVAVSDADAKMLGEFVEAFRQAREPADENRSR